jgi:hypothetical protein
VAQEIPKENAKGESEGKREAHSRSILLVQDSIPCSHQRLVHNYHWDDGGLWNKLESMLRSKQRNRTNRLQNTIMTYIVGPNPNLQIGFKNLKSGVDETYCKGCLKGGVDVHAGCVICDEYCGDVGDSPHEHHIRRTSADVENAGFYILEQPKSGHG